jgi:copper oxidase (laccase) domain-containing protein
MNKFDKQYNNFLTKVYQSMSLNEYVSDDDEETEQDPALTAAAAAGDDTDVGRAKEKHDQELKRVLQQKTKNLKQAGSALKRPAGG